MKKVFLDAGTTWTKILTIENNNKNYSIIKTSQLKNLNLKYYKCTGHSIDREKDDYENEVVALAWGIKKIKEDNCTVLDLGSRDIKYIQFQNKQFKDMDWNCSCASATGATIEMLLKFYNVKIEDLKFTKEKYAITCGIFGLEKIMDDIAKGINPSAAISKFIHGIAYNAYNFAKNPKKIFVSGGFCENKCFLDSLSNYCDVVPLGRFVLVDGLNYMDSLKENLQPQ